VQIAHTDQGELVVECPVKSTNWSSDHRLFEARVALKRCTGTTIHGVERRRPGSG
jgi:hypothetical protein